MTTRDYDIQKIEEDMSKGLISQERGKALINKMYRQTRDHDLEDRRKKLIDDQRRNVSEYRAMREDPDKMSESQLKHAIEYFSSNPNEF